MLGPKPIGSRMQEKHRSNIATCKWRFQSNGILERKGKATCNSNGWWHFFVSFKEPSLGQQLFGYLIRPLSTPIAMEPDVSLSLAPSILTVVSHPPILPDSSLCLNRLDKRHTSSIDRLPLKPTGEIQTYSFRQMEGLQREKASLFGNFMGLQTKSVVRSKFPPPRATSTQRKTT